jgi:glycosyltransferase involved in cell wall biosynthesis
MLVSEHSYFCKGEEMKIAIIGTRGIPNRYGGFEQFAEIVSQYWVASGHEVICYNPHSHFYDESSYKGVRIIKKYNPESTLGAAANFIYDFLCLKDAVKNKCDILLELGYQSSSISFLTVTAKHRKKIVTNMDGLEWKRDKWSPTIKKITRWAEKLAVKYSGALISDNKGIAKYYKENFGVESHCIAYGCEEVPKLDKSLYYDVLGETSTFDLLIARLEPENSIETILQGVLNSNSRNSLVVVGNHETSYGNMLKEKYSDKRINFVGAIYNKEVLDALRQHSRIYFHGHTVGGTNPSLLEAMAAGSNIIAHGNEFNRAVLKEQAYYFIESSDITELVNKANSLTKSFSEFRSINMERIKEVYNWELISKAYLKTFESVIKQCE